MSTTSSADSDRWRHDPPGRSADDGRGGGPQANGPGDEHRGRPGDARPDPRPEIGGLILDNTTWRRIFYVNLPIGLIAVVAAVRVLPTVARQRTENLDFVGLALMATGLPLVTCGLAEIGVTGGFGSVMAA